VQVVDKREDSSVLNHEFNEGHTFSGEILLKVHIENLGKCSHDDLNLRVGQDFQGLLILELKMSLISEQQAGKAKQVHQE
jgi:hypothetical protein